MQSLKQSILIAGDYMAGCGYLRTILLAVISLVAEPLSFIGATAPPPLEVYFVSSEAKPGWRFFNSTEFSILGYIADRPDLLITHLTDVYLKTTLHRSTMVRMNGATDTEEWEPRPTVIIEFLPQDVDALCRLTASHLGQHMLFLQDNEPLFAPLLMDAIDTSTLSIILPKETDPEKIRNHLAQLCDQKH